VTVESEAGMRVRLRDSLRLRLPALIALVTTAGLMGVVWFSFREVEGSHRRAGVARAQGAADQLAGVFERAAAQSLEQVRTAAGDAVLQRFLVDPSEPNGVAVKARWESLRAQVPRVLEVWTTDGQRLLAMGMTGSGPHAGKTIPDSTEPPRVGVGRIRVLDDQLVFMDLVVPIPMVPSEDLSRPGVLLVRTTIRITVPVQLSDLIGGQPAIMLGNAGGAEWTNLSKVVPAPTIATTARGGHEYISPGGEPRIAAIAPVPNTPWAVWVDYSMRDVVAPASEFVARSAAFGAAVVVAVFAIVLVITSRLTTPLQALTAAASEMAAGNWSRRVPVLRRDEVGRLSTAFNRMADEIQLVNRAITDVNDRTEFALGAAQMGIAELDIDADRITSLHALGTVLGVAPEAVPATMRDVLDIVHPDDRALVRSAVTQALAQRRDEVAATFRVLRPDDRVGWLDARARLFCDPAGRPLRALGVVIDVTRRMALEEQLRQAQKLEGVGQLAGGVAHDFNNLLTAILGFAELLRDSLPPGERLSQHAHEIIQAGKRGAGLTRQLLAFSRRQVLEPSVLLRRLIGEHIRLTTKLSPESPRVLADRSQIEQVIVNLAVNARDAMPEGGLLTIETARVELNDSYATERFMARPGPYVMIAVSDTGVGMNAETRRRLFEPFFTTKERGRGTGLGLATVYGIVTQSGGYVWAYSEEGSGTVFKVYLPPTDQPPQTIQPVSTAETSSRGSELVLIVEDDDAVRQLSRRILEGAGYRVREAANAEVAEGVFTSDVDILVSDVIMPGSSGPELYRRLLARKQTLKVLFTSGYTDDMIDKQGRVSSDTAFLQKPFTPDGLCQKVRKVIDA
jgi:PAS domain S-box-containing protein